MKRFMILSMVLTVLVPLAGCGSSQADTELEAIAERAKARDEAQAYYLNYFGIQAIGRSPYQEWQFKQFAPTYGTFEAYKALSPIGNELWGDYLINTGILKSREQAGGLFRQALARPLREQQVFLEKMGRYFVDDKMGSLLVDFMRSVLEQRYGSPLVESMINRMPSLELEFKGNPGYTERSFLEFLRQKYNLW